MACADRVTSASATAVTVAWVLAVTDAGAVYSPLPSTVPVEAVQFTPVLELPATVAVNCCCCVGNSVLVAGLTLMVTPPPPLLPPPPVPPHDPSISAVANTTIIDNMVQDRLLLCRDKLPNTRPATEIQATNGAGPWFFAVGRCRVPVFGPRVLIASVMFCTPLAPAAICGDEHAAPAGSPEQAKVTRLGNVVPAGGVTVRL